MISLARDKTREFLDGLWADKTSMFEAIVADGWPEEMTRAGLAMHRRAWDADKIADAVEQELGPLRHSKHHRLVLADRAHHIWPALPGAGLVPVVVTMLLGISQGVRPSSRGLHFARVVADHGDFDLLEPDAPWQDVQAVVVSGSDETLAAIRDEMGGRGEVIGYGHRVSFAVVVDDESSVDLAEVADLVARDIVMWHQKGCFSAQAVLFCGDDTRRQAFGRALAASIAKLEQRWGTGCITDGELARRAQALGVAELTGEVYVEGIGFVHLTDEPFDGVSKAVHSVTVHRIETPADIERAVDLRFNEVQGVGIGGAWDTERHRWIAALGATGATRICPAGQLQKPPPNWWHDGRPNALSLGRVVTIG